MRSVYDSEPFDEDQLAPTWHEQLSGWLAEAIAAEVADPNAMVLATADDDGLPSSRTVLAKGIDERGLVFYTNYTSRKMHDLRANRFASATFLWAPLHRQVHLRGPIRMCSAEETAAYWQTRPRLAQLGAWASPQSSVVRNRHTLEAALDQVTKRFADTEQVPVPPHWGGVRISPQSVEFWQGRPHRLHDRLRFRLDDHGRWTVQRLAP